jgi:WD40 repeat protein
MSDQTERDFIFGILAAQLGLAAPRQVVAAAAAWLADRTRSIPQRLLAEGVLDQQKARHLEAMAAQVLAAGGGDVMETIAQTNTAPTDTAPTLRASSPSAPAGSVSTDDATLLDERRGAVVSTEGITGVTPESPARYSFLGGARESAVVGRGGLGRVMIAFDEHLGRRVAVKELLSDVSDTAGAIVRLLKEARVTAQLEHPNIVPVYEIGKRLDGSLYYTMKLVQGRTLAAALKACTSLDERLKLLPHFVALCNAIAYAHSRGVIHRDVKTENVMVGEFGETVVLDWGVAKARGKKEEAEGESAGLTSVTSLIPDGGAGSTVEGAAIGTPSYMSPEQAMGKLDEVDEQSDVWSLGAVLYEILTGHPPFTGKTTMQVLGRVLTEPVIPARRIDEAIPPELASICEKALSREKTSRYRSAREIAEEIEAFRSGARVRFHEYSSMELFRRFAAKNKAALLAACAILAVIVAALVMVSLSFRSEKSAREREHEALEKEKREHLIANFHIAQAFNEKADRLEKEKRSLESRIFAAASLLHNPSNPKSPYASPTFAGLFPESDLLNVEAASIIYRSSLGLVLSYGGSLKADDAFSDAAFSPDGKLIAAGNFDRKVRVWDVETKHIVHTFEGHGDSVSDVTFSPDGRLLASASADRTVRLWDLQEGRALLTLQACENKVQCAAFSADGARVAAGCTEGKITVWDAAAGAPLLTLAGHEGWVMGIAFSPDGKTIVSGSYDKTVRIWDAATGAPLAALTGQGKRVTDVVFSPDGRFLASSDWEGTIMLWDTRTWAAPRPLEVAEGGATSLAFSPDGKLILAGSGDKTVRVWDVESGKQVIAVGGHRDLVMGVDFSPDGRTLASASYDKSVKLWNLDARRSVLTLDGHTDWIFGAAFSPDGKRLASASLDKTLKVWDISTGKLVFSIEGQQGFVWQVAYSPDGGRLASGCADGTVGIWDARTGRPIHTMKGHLEAVHSVAFSPDGRRLASAGDDRTVRLWDTASGKQVAVLEGHEGKVWEVTFSPDGKSLASASSDNTARLWDVESGKVLRTLPHAQWATSVDFSPDGRTIATTGKDGTAALWDASTGKKLKVLLGHEQWVNTVRFSPDGKHIATASDDGRFGIWSVDTGKLILVISVVESGGDSAVAFSPDGQWLATDHDKSILVFPLDFSILAPHPRTILDEAQASSGMILDGFELKTRE